MNELTAVTRNGTLTVAGLTTAVATNVTVNTSNAVVYADWTFAAGNFTIELDTPTIAPVLPTKFKRWDGFSATNDKKARLHQTEPPNALPASERCPGQPSMAFEFFTLTTQFAFGHGGDHPSYVNQVSG